MVQCTMLMNDIHIGSENGNHTTKQSNLDSCKNKQQFKTLPILVWKASQCILQVLETKIECFKSCTMVQCKVFLRIDNDNDTGLGPSPKIFQFLLLLPSAHLLPKNY